MSENETDMKLQAEAMETLTKYGYFSKETKVQSMDIKQTKLASRGDSSVTRENG